MNHYLRLFKLFLDLTASEIKTLAIVVNAMCETL